MLPYFDERVLVALGKLTVYFRYLDWEFADTLGRIREAVAQPRGSRPGDSWSFSKKLNALEKLAKSEPDKAAEYNIPSIIKEARQIASERNAFLHGIIKLDLERGGLVVERSDQRQLTAEDIQSLCDRIDKLFARARLMLHEWSTSVREGNVLLSKIVAILDSVEIVDPVD